MCIDFWKLVTIFIAGFATWISWSQHSVNKEKFKLDLFEKRFLIFAATRKILLVVLQKPNISIADLSEYRANTAEATFLFDSDTVEYLNRIYKRVLDLHMLHEAMKPLLEGDERLKEKSREIAGHRKWLTDESQSPKFVFSPYMKFKTWK